MKILVIAGEASADLHAGFIFQKLKEKIPVELIGIGGDHLIQLGLKPLAKASDMAVVGLTEAVAKIPQSIRLFRELEILAEKEKPDLAFLIDLPDFNLRVGPKLHALKIPILYYVSPQVWAWRGHRVFSMAKFINKLLCILPFEKDWYEKNAPEQFQVKYVGHPALEEIPNLAYAPDSNTIALLPGSREKEVLALYPVMIGALKILHQNFPNLKIILPLAPTLRNNTAIQRFLREGNEEIEAFVRMKGNNFQIVEDAAPDIVRKAKLTLVASGSATLETALVGAPMIVLYKVSWLTAFLFQHFIKYKGPVAMANILHVGFDPSRRVVPELLQNDITGEKIAAAVSEILNNNEIWQKQVEILQNTRSILSQGISSPTETVVEQILDFMEHRP